MYPDVETLILTQLQNVTGFSSANTSRGNWGILNSGKDVFYGILKPGTFGRSQGAMSMNISTWNTVIQVWQRYKDDGSTLTNLETNVKNIIARFDAYRKAGDTTGTIVDVFIAEGREVEEMWTKDGGLSWLKQDVIVQSQEHDNVTYSE
jgi:hypothetical protein